MTMTVTGSGTSEAVLSLVFYFSYNQFGESSTVSLLYAKA